jgi:hypothetical protein
MKTATIGLISRSLSSRSTAGRCRRSGYSKEAGAGRVSIDAEAICEGVTRPSMRFILVKN